MTKYKCTFTNKYIKEGDIVHVTFNEWCYYIHDTNDVFIYKESSISTFIMMYTSIKELRRNKINGLLND